MVDDLEDFTVELMLELNFEVGRGLPVKGEKVFWEDSRLCKGIDS